MTLAFEPSDPFEPSSPTECCCVSPDDQYLLDIDCGSAYLTHAACGKPAQGWIEGAFDLNLMPVTLHWHHEPAADSYEEDTSHGHLTVNGLTVVHQDVPYLIGRDYADRDGALWRITGDRDHAGRPLAYVLPEGAGDGVPLADVVGDFGPLTLVPLETEDGQ